MCVRGQAGALSGARGGADGSGASGAARSFPQLHKVSATCVSESFCNFRELHAMAHFGGASCRGSLPCLLVRVAALCSSPALYILSPATLHLLHCPLPVSISMFLPLLPDFTTGLDEGWWQHAGLGALLLLSLHSLPCFLCLHKPSH